MVDDVWRMGSGMKGEKKKKITRLILSLIQAMNIWLPADSHAWGLMLFPDYSLLHTHTHTHQSPHPTLSWVGLNNKAAPAQVVYPDTKAIPHIN